MKLGFACLFTLCLDETNNSSGYKQLDLTAIFWCSNQQRIRVEFLTSIYMKIDRKDVIEALAGNRAPPKLCSAEIIHAEVMNFLKTVNISAKNVLAINRDGPHVMTAFIKLFTSSNPDVIDFGSCKLHTLHNCVEKAMGKLKFNVLQFALDMKYFFKGQALRSEEFAALRDELDLPNLKLIDHSGTRFLTLLHFVNRVLTLLDALRTYFVHYLPKKGLADLAKNDRYERLRSAFASKKTDIYLLFLSEALPLFQEMQLFLQRDDPIGPEYVYRICGMMASLGGRFLLPSVCEDIVVSKISTSSTAPENHSSDVDIGHRTERLCLKNLQSAEMTHFKLEAKAFYLEAFHATMSNLKLDQKEHMRLWRKLTLLCPQNRTFQSDKDKTTKLKNLTFLAGLIPTIKVDDMQPLIEEWKQLAINNDIQPLKEERLDAYWSKIFEKHKYPLIKVLVQALLCIQPHNAAEERGFSVNAAVVTKERNRLQPETLNGIRRVRSHLKNIDGLQHFSVTQSLIDLARSSSRRYFQSYDRVSTRPGYPG